jgi:hypothetical protein
MDNGTRERDMQCRDPHRQTQPRKNHTMVLSYKGGENAEQGVGGVNAEGSTTAGYNV